VFTCVHIFSLYFFLCHIKTFAHAVVIMLVAAENHLLLVNRTFLMKCKIVENLILYEHRYNMMRGGCLKMLLRISDELFSNRDIKKRLGSERMRRCIAATRPYLSVRFPSALTGWWLRPSKVTLVSPQFRQCSSKVTLILDISRMTPWTELCPRW